MRRRRSRLDGLNGPLLSERPSPTDEQSSVTAAEKETAAIVVRGPSRTFVSITSLERSEPDLLSHRVAEQHAEDGVGRPMPAIDHSPDADASDQGVRRDRDPCIAKAMTEKRSTGRDVRDVSRGNRVLPPIIAWKRGEFVLVPCLLATRVCSERTLSGRTRPITRYMICDRTTL